MNTVLQPLGVRCNIRCHYCYENPERDAGDTPPSYDLDRMKVGIEEEGGGPFLLFGGEPLLMPAKDLEELWSWGYEKYGSNRLQTNGTLIRDEHIRLIRKYNVAVGISVDGPGELNDARWAGTLERTRKATEKTHAAIERLCEEGIVPNILVVLHRCNASAEKLPRLCDWFRSLESLGIRFARLHTLGIDSEQVRQDYSLGVEESLQALLTLAVLERTLTSLAFDVFVDMRNLLLGRDEILTCTWQACDPYTTLAVRGVNGQGQHGNCGKIYKDGVSFVKSAREGYERYLALYNTPQEHGGCKGCRFFLMCKGQCPGEALDGDWRNRTEHCEVWKGLFEHFESKMIEDGSMPLSTSPLREHLEQRLCGAWTSGRNATIAEALEALR